MTELRYDGPDLEADTSGRAQGLLMSSVMALDGASHGRSAAQQREDQRRHDATVASERQDRALWAGVPTADWAGLSDGTLATRWQAAARHTGDRDADRARGAIERELTDRDPETMRDYRSWRYGANCDPGAAMQQALRERERRLAVAWRPIAQGRGTSLDETQLAAGWVAALAAHDPDARLAAATGEAVIRERFPELLDSPDRTRGGAGLATGATAPQGIAGDPAAATQTGHRRAFGPGTAWADTLHHGDPTPAHPSTGPLQGRPAAGTTPAGPALALHAAHAAQHR
jgi:hypothetical protein